MEDNFEDMTEDDDSTTQQRLQQQNQPAVEGNKDDDDASVEDVEDRLRAVVLNTSSTLHYTSVQRSPNSPFLSEEKKWQRAKYIFPGILKAELKYRSNPKQSVEDLVWEMIFNRFREMCKTNNSDNLDDLVSNPFRGVELCIELGINKIVVEKRFEVINNLRKELKVDCITSTLIQIRHLAYTFGTVNSYGDKDHINAGNDRDTPATIIPYYRGKKWQSYMGICLRPGYTRQALKIMEDEIANNALTNCYVHGTNGKALQGIHDKDGTIAPSLNSPFAGGIRHDFGSGIYATEGKYNKALCWGIDSCWPIYNTESKSFDSYDPACPMGHNPAIVVFTKPVQFNRTEKDKWVLDVHSRPPFTDDQLSRRGWFEEYSKKRESYKKNPKYDFNWKCFVKLARAYNKTPSEPLVFHGRLHHPFKTKSTDDCNAPIMDSDEGFIQYCFKESDDLGTDRLFIEFNVNWNEWLDDYNNEKKVTVS
mmetsp:Transcript_30445/g.73965  ORF Transcript_30445/g.73965 Transcript_30445/m.73965 type:complete len:478 (-) Transcript_30445:456-1889(-)